MEQILCNRVGHQPHCLITSWPTSIKLGSRLKHKQSYSFCKSWYIDSLEAQICVITERKVVNTQPLLILFHRAAAQPTCPQFQVNHGAPPGPGEPWMQSGCLQGRTWEIPTTSWSCYYNTNFCKAKAEYYCGRQSTGWKFLPEKTSHETLLHFCCRLLLSILWLHWFLFFFLKKLARIR